MATTDVPASSGIPDLSVNLAFVLEQEAIEIKKHGLTEGDERPDRFGLSFSGGGIRSACVALGVSQSLARRGLFGKVQYISAISGGGYMLGALTAWIKRSEGGFHAVNESLALSADPALPVPAAVSAEGKNVYPRFLEPDFIRNLRRYSSYLTPRLGLLGGDTLALASIYLRNLLLNLVMMVSAVFALMLIAQAVAPQRLWHGPWSKCAVFDFLLAMAVCFLGAVAAVGKEIQVIHNASGEGSVARTRLALLLGFAGCTLLWIVTPSLYSYRGVKEAYAITAGLAVFGFCANYLGFKSWGQEKKPSVHAVSTVTPLVLAMAWLAAAGLVACIAIVFFNHLAFPGKIFVGGGYVIFGLPLILASFPLVSYLFIGVLGDQLPDAEREWLARFAGYFLSGAACVALLIAIAIDGPAWVEWIGCMIRNWGWKGASAALIPGGWLYVTISGVLLGRSSSTGGKKPAYNFTNLIVAVAPFVFLVGVLVQVSWGADALLSRTGTISSLVSTPTAPAKQAGKASSVACCQPSCESANKDAANGCVLKRQNGSSYPRQASSELPGIDIRILKEYGPEFRYLSFLLGFAAVALILARRLDINEFSMHLFYRNRLVRAFPGASNSERRANVFTNFSLSDDFPLRSLVRHPVETGADGVKELERGYDGPYPLWGTALNMTHGEDLSWQQRKAASFIYSPLFCGWDYVSDSKAPTDLIRPELPRAEKGDVNLAPFGFRSTKTYGGEGGKPMIGTAMAASGAAASPNMGYHTRPGVAALLAIFNVRLGWWTGNPRDNKTYCTYAPGAGYLLNELLGSTDATSSYVYLSDGGHFENLGLYELVRRRMRLIIVSDADCDASYTFGDLGNAIEHCRRDFGVHIEIRAADDMAAVVKANLPEPDQRFFRKQHYAIGKISYPKLASESEATGYLLYLKTSLTGDEPTDVLAMRAAYPSFPHDSTGNQFFNESLFESYRALGEHMMSSALDDIKKKKEDSWMKKAEWDALRVELGKLSGEDFVGQEALQT